MQVYDVPQTVDLIEAVRGHRVFIPVSGSDVRAAPGRDCRARWRNVDLDKATLSVVQSAEQTRAGVRYTEPKRGRTRNVSLSADVVDELRAWRVSRPRNCCGLASGRPATR